ncbi:MAG: hypothetical protein ACO1OT_12460 [Heyndrickxia sp.]
MDELIGKVIVFLFIGGFIYGLIRQIKHTITIQKVKKTALPKYSRLLIGNYLMCISFFGFIISFLLNVFVGMQIVRSNDFITSNTTCLSCFVFLLTLLMAKYWVIPKNINQTTYFVK